MKVREFNISIDKDRLKDLKMRLYQTRWPEELDTLSQVTGIDLSYMKGFKDYWTDGYNWKKQEDIINDSKGYMAEIDGVGIHFLKIPGKGQDPLPLMLLHGWPSSFLEMQKIIPMLTDPLCFGRKANQSFDLVIPTLPGFGFSGKPERGGMNYRSIADRLARLMTEYLDYKKFCVHGVDWGAAVTDWMGYRYKDNILGIHVCGLLQSKGKSGSQKFQKASSDYADERNSWYEREGGYFHIQSTKPVSLAYAFNDSPMGLAAWILEKYFSWSDCSGNIETRFNKDELISNIMIYWLTSSIGSSMRIYSESKDDLLFEEDQKVEVPTAVAVFPKDVDIPKKIIAEKTYNIQRWTEMPKGGHFPAMEEPGLLVNDICDFFSFLR